MILDKEQRQYNEAKTVFSTNGAETSGHPHAKKKNLNPDLTPFKRINSKSFMDLNVKHTTIKLLEDDTGEN